MSALTDLFTGAHEKRLAAVQQQLDDLRKDLLAARRRDAAHEIGQTGALVNNRAAIQGNRIRISNNRAEVARLDMEIARLTVLLVTVTAYLRSTKGFDQKRFDALLVQVLGSGKLRARVKLTDKELAELMSLTGTGVDKDVKKKKKG